MKYIINLSLVLSVLFLASCEGNTEFLLNVKNSSSESIILAPQIGWSNTNYADTMVLPAGETVEIARWSERGGRPNSVDITSYMSESKLYGEQVISDKVLDSTIHKSNSRWVETIEEKKKVPSNIWHYYELTLTDTDFQ